MTEGTNTDQALEAALVESESAEAAPDAPEVLPDEVKLGDITVRLAAPAKFSVCQNVIVAYTRAPMSGIFAALGLCWRAPKEGRPKTVYAHDALAYGADVMDRLVDDHPWDDLVDAAVVAYAHISRQAGKRIVTKEQIDSSVGFTEPRTGE